MERELGIAYLAVAVLIVVAAVPLLLGWVRRNSWYGIRIPAAFESEASWLRVNRYGARCLLAWAAALALLGAVCLLLPTRLEGLALLGVVLAPLATLFPVIVAILRYGDRTASRP